MNPAGPLGLLAAGLQDAEGHNEVHLRWLSDRSLLFPLRGFVVQRRPGRLSCCTACFIDHPPPFRFPEGEPADQLPWAPLGQPRRGLFIGYEGERVITSAVHEGGVEWGLLLPPEGVEILLPRPTLRTELRLVALRSRTHIGYEASFRGRARARCATVLRQSGPHERRLCFGPADQLRIWSESDSHPVLLVELRTCLPGAPDEGWEAPLTEHAVDLPLPSAPPYPTGDSGLSGLEKATGRLRSRWGELLGVDHPADAVRLPAEELAERAEAFAALQGALLGMVLGLGPLLPTPEGSEAAVNPDVFIDTLRAAALDPEMARLLGYYLVDREVEPGRRYDYRVHGRWPLEGVDRMEQRVLWWEEALEEPNDPVLPLGASSVTLRLHRTAASVVGQRLVLTPSGDAANWASSDFVFADPWEILRFWLDAPSGAIVELRAGPDDSLLDVFAIAAGSQTLELTPIPGPTGPAGAMRRTEVTHVRLSAFDGLELDGISASTSARDVDHFAHAFDVGPECALRWPGAGRVETEVRPWWQLPPAGQGEQGPPPLPVRGVAVALRWGVSGLLLCAPEEGVPVARPVRYHVERVREDGTSEDLTGSSPVVVPRQWVPASTEADGEAPAPSEPSCPEWFFLDTGGGAGEGSPGLALGQTVTYRVVGEDLFGRRGLVGESGPVELSARFPLPAPEAVVARLEADEEDNGGGLEVSWSWPRAFEYLYREVQAFQVVFSPHSPHFARGRIDCVRPYSEDDPSRVVLRTSVPVTPGRPVRPELRVRGGVYPVVDVEDGMDEALADCPDEALADDPDAGGQPTAFVAELPASLHPDEGRASAPEPGDVIWVEYETPALLRLSEAWPVRLEEAPWRIEAVRVPEGPVPPELREAAAAGGRRGAGPGADTPSRRYSTTIPAASLEEYLAWQREAGEPVATWWVGVAAVTGEEPGSPERFGPVAPPVQVSVVQALLPPAVELEDPLVNPRLAVAGTPEPRAYAGCPDGEGRCTAEVRWEADARFRGVTFEVCRAAESALLSALFGEAVRLRQGDGPLALPEGLGELLGGEGAELLALLEAAVQAGGPERPVAWGSLPRRLALPGVQAAAVARWLVAREDAGQRARPSLFRQVGTVEWDGPHWYVASDRLEASAWKDRTFHRVRTVLPSRPAEGAWSNVVGPLSIPHTVRPRRPQVRDAFGETDRETGLRQVTLMWLTVGDEAEVAYEVYRTRQRSRATSVRLMRHLEQVALERTGDLVTLTDDSPELLAGTWFYRVVAVAAESQELVREEDPEAAGAERRLVATPARSRPSRLVPVRLVDGTAPAAPAQPTAELEVAEDGSPRVRLRWSWSEDQRYYADFESGVFRRLQEDGAWTAWEQLARDGEAGGAWLAATEAAAAPDAPREWAWVDVPPGGGTWQYQVLARSPAGRLSEGVQEPVEVDVPGPAPEEPPEEPPEDEGGEAGEIRGPTPEARELQIFR